MAPVSFMFEKKGLVTIDPSRSNISFDELFEAAVEAGAEDIQEIEGEEGTEWAVRFSSYTMIKLNIQVYTELSDLGTVNNQLTTPPLDKDLAVISSEPAYVPSDPLDVRDDGMGLTEEQADLMVQVSEALEEDGDVVKVWSNLA